MKSFFSARRIRYTAALTLFVWLTSLGIGVANACLAQQDYGQGEYLSHGRSGANPTALPERQVAPDHFARSSFHFDENTYSPEKTTCLKFCVAQQSTVVTDHLSGLPQLDLGPVLFLTGLLLPGTAQKPTPHAFANLTWSEPPVSIRYLRLTI